MRAIEAVADLGALNQWAFEYHIASEAAEPRRRTRGASKPTTEAAGATPRLSRGSTKEGSGSRSGSLERTPLRSSLKSRDEDRGSAATTPNGEMCRVPSRNSQARSSRSTKEPVPSSPCSALGSLALENTEPSPVPSPAASQSRHLAASDFEDAGSLALAIREERPSTSTLALATRSEDLALVPVARPSPKTRRMKTELLSTHPWLQQLQQRSLHGSVPSSPSGARAFGGKQASSASTLPPLDNLQIQLHDGQKMELVAYSSPRAASRGSFQASAEEPRPVSRSFRDLATWGSKDERDLMATSTSGQRQEQGLLPQSIRSMDFWRATELFNLFDRRTGELDKLAFYHLLTAASRDKENINRSRSDTIFDEIDIDGSGKIDKEEFLGWVFQTNNSFLSSVRRRLESMDQLKVKALFEQMDNDGNRVIDKDEFWEFVEKFSPGMLSRSASDELHEFIDADKSGGIDVEEFLNWVHPGRELKMLRAEVPDDKAITGKVAAGMMAVDENSYVAPKKPLMETEPGKPVVLEFWIGSEWTPSFESIKRSLRSVFSSHQIRFQMRRDPRVIHTCSKLVAKVGRGIVLWDRDSMLAFKDDPFMNQATAGKWIKEVLLQCLPDVINAANVRLLKRKKLHVCFECGKSLEGSRFMNVLEYKVCSKHCAGLLKARAVIED
ncbi:cal-1 [Symbiodinium pilosum]|uniref:Cal-1 protein n=1 Tax=Symbiodinium pilosum TaxID=2952 RepID=A0A812W2B9_SYMPI|nr:cal-1 [Symbiodinium pilosum]